MLKANYTTLSFQDKNRPAFSGAVFGSRKLLMLLIVLGMALGIAAIFKQSSLPQMSESFVAANVSNTADPVELSVPALKIKAPFEFLGLKKDGSIEVPKKDNQVGWYKYGTKIGDVGPAVVVGHLDSTKGPAVFANLKKLKPGDQIVVKRADGSEAVFKVDSIEKFSQNQFPTEKVYGAIDHAGLRLITCAGAYSKKLKRYSDNLVVFAKKVDN